MRLGLLPNVLRDKNLSYTKEVIDFLREQNPAPHVFLLKEFEGLIEGVNFDTLSSLCQNCDFAVILGGDGTILDKISCLAKFNTPFLGINLGSVGYLTSTEKSTGKKALTKLLAGNCKTEKRIMLETSLQGTTHTALNDIYIKSFKLTDIALFINGEYTGNYNADGVIISTPTGSTAYNLSAGGPVVDPCLDVIIITFICPHKLNVRPLVVSGDACIHLEVKNKEGVSIFVDGRGFTLTQKIIIKKSVYYAEIVRTSEQNFYDVLRRKLN